MPGPTAGSAVPLGGEALRAIEAAPARKRRPEVILAALHDLALAGRAPALAAAYAAEDGDAAAGAAIEVLLRMTDSVVAIAVRRKVRTNERGACWRGWQIPRSSPAITATGPSRFRSCISWLSVITTFAANVGR